MFPVPNLTYRSATLLGGSEFTIAQTSRNKDLAWELITLILDPKIMVPFHIKYAPLPAQVPIGNGPYTALLNQTIPYYNQLVETLSIARLRPNIPKYPQIADDIRQAIEQIYSGIKEPKQALDEAAMKAAHTLGW